MSHTASLGGTASKRELTQRDRAIIRLKQEGKTNQVIGDALGGITSERVRQLAHRLILQCGESIFEPEVPEFTPQEVAKTTHIPLRIIHQLCDKKEIPCVEQDAHQYLLNGESIKQLLAHPSVTERKLCVVCKQPFLRTSYSQITCSSQECRKRRKQQRHVLQSADVLAPESLRAWHLDLWRALQFHTIPDNERWLTRKDAMRLSKLSKMQMDGLGHRHILTVRPHPTKIAGRNGKPERTYAASELLIAREAYESYQLRQDSSEHHVSESYVHA